MHGAFEGTQGYGKQVHQDRQDKHVEGTKNYRQEIAKGRHPSVLTEDPAVLLAEGAGKGHYPSPGREVVDYGRVVGRFYDRATKQYHETTRATIHYDTKGNAHVVPAQPEWLRSKRLR